MAKEFLTLYLSFVLIASLLSCQSGSSDNPQGNTVDSTLVETDSIEERLFHPFDPMDEIIGLSEQWTGDLEGMIERQRIRALVPYSRTTYYIDGAERHGIAYEAMMHFEKALNQKLGLKIGPDYVRVVFIPLRRDQLIPALLEGYGDIIPANLMVTGSRKDQMAFSTPTFSGAREIFVSGPRGPELSDTASLAGKTVHIRRSSSFYEHLQDFNQMMKDKGWKPLKIEFLEEHFEDEEVMEMISAGMLPLAVVDESLATFWGKVLDSLRIHNELAIREGGKLAWAMRKDNASLKAFVDEFVLDNRKGKLLGNIIFNRYLKNTEYVADAFSTGDLDRLLDMRDYFIKYGEQYDLDWLMLAAQGFQESRLDQNVRSPVGALGVMQIKPSTARDKNVGIDDITDLENNIHAGTKYMRFLIDRYFSEPELDSLNANLLALAAYNAGPARVRKLRKKAAYHGLDPNIWFDHVELMAARDIGRETVQYVSNIYKYYTSYRSLYRYMQQTGKVPFQGW